MRKTDIEHARTAGEQGLTRAERKEYQKCAVAMEMDYPLMFIFIKSLDTFSNSRRIGIKRMAYLYHLFIGCKWISSETGPHDLGSNSEAFWDLADEAARQGKDRAYAMESVLLLYQHLGRMRKLRPSFRQGIRTPENLLYNEEFRKFMLFSYEKKDNVFILRHGKQKTNTMLLVLDYRNVCLRNLLVDFSLRWPGGWVNRRIPSPLLLLQDAEGWFERTTDNVGSWRDFNTKMLDTAKRHIVGQYEDREQRRLAMRFLFHFWSELVLSHPKHDFFRGSYVWCPEMVINKLIPNYLADGYEIAVNGQRDPFRQGRGALFVLHEADLCGASNRRIEIRRYDLQKVSNPRHWDALANFILHNEKADFTEARHFLIWLVARKNAIREDPCTIHREDMDAYRLSIAHRTNNNSSRNTLIVNTKRALLWMKDSEYLSIDENAMDEFSYFFINQEPQPAPLEKEMVAAVAEALHRMGAENPRYYLTEILFKIMLLTEPRSGSLVTVLMDNITWYEDGTSLARTIQKSNGKAKTPIPLGKEPTSLLKKAIELTQSIRDKYPMLSISNHVFLYELENKTMPVNAMSIQRFNLDLEAAGEAACNKKVNSGILRDTMFSILKLYMIKKNIPEYKRPALTHHARPRSINAYSVITIQDILEHAPQYSVGHILKTVV